MSVSARNTIPVIFMIRRFRYRYVEVSTHNLISSPFDWYVIPGIFGFGCVVNNLALLYCRDTVRLFVIQRGLGLLVVEVLGFLWTISIAQAMWRFSLMVSLELSWIWETEIFAQVFEAPARVLYNTTPSHFDVMDDPASDHHRNLTLTWLHVHPARMLSCLSPSRFEWHLSSSPQL